MKKTALLMAFLFWALLPGKLMAQPELDARTMEILGQCTDFLQKTSHLIVEAEVTTDLLEEGGHKLQFTKYLEMKISRPGHLYARVTGDLEQRSFWIDGQKLTVLDAGNEVHYASFELDGPLDSFLNKAYDEYGISLPLADIVYSDAFAGVYDAIQEAHYIDLSEVNGHRCHHLAFYQENVDWQIWVQESPFPILRKLVITYKEQPMAPQYAVEFTTFDVHTELPEHAFKFTPPPGSSEIELLKTEN